MPITMNVPFSITEKTAYAEYGYFGVASENAKYKLGLGSYSGKYLRFNLFEVYVQSFLLMLLKETSLSSTSVECTLLQIYIPFPEA